MAAQQIEASSLGPGHPGSLGPHDVGGLDLAEYAKLPLNTADHAKAQWEKEMDVLLGVLWNNKYMNIDQLRRGIEYLEPEPYANWTYYGRWAASMTRILVENKVITQEEIDAELGPTQSEETVLFKVGDKVTVKPESTKSRWRKPHIRTPGYIYGCTGVIERVAGVFPNPEVGAFRTQHQIMAPLYRVRFALKDIWPENPAGANVNTTVDVEIYQHWLQPFDPFVASAAAAAASAAVTASSRSAGSHDHDGHDHDHDHDSGAHSHSADHGHTHEARIEVEQNAVDKEGPPHPEQQLAAALLNLCIAKGITTREQIRAYIDGMDTAYGKLATGPTLVAKAWTDPEFKRKLQEDCVKAARELGLVANSGAEPEMVAVFNEPGIHNVIVCTLCSCCGFETGRSMLFGVIASLLMLRLTTFSKPTDPRAVLGFPPDWYKSRTYRSRMVRDPRKLLAESFDLHLPESTELRVHDSTADLRYIVIPERPAGTEGWSEEKLKALVTRDTMIGVAVCKVGGEGQPKI